MKKKIEEIDNINHPKHYQGVNGKFEVMDVIEEFELDYCRGCAVKYILRAELKNNNVEDIKKAIWYLERYIKQQS